jgi:hypothetical protein
MSLSQQSVGVTVVALYISQQFDNVSPFYRVLLNKDLTVSPLQSSLSQRSDSVTLVSFCSTSRHLPDFLVKVLSSGFLERVGYVAE